MGRKLRLSVAFKVITAARVADRQARALFLREARGTKARFLLTSRREEQGWLGELPARIAVHWDLAGVANHWLDKGHALALGPVFSLAVTLFMIACEPWAVREPSGSMGRIYPLAVAAMADGAGSIQPGILKARTLTSQAISNSR